MLVWIAPVWNYHGTPSTSLPVILLVFFPCSIISRGMFRDIDTAPSLPFSLVFTCTYAYTYS